MQIKHGNKKTPFYMSSNKYFLKNGAQDNHWIRHLVMKQIDDVKFQKRKATGEGKNDQNGSFLMKVF